MGVVEDELVAAHKAKPMILVMPFGSTGTFTDKEWANGILPHEGWETFLARDVVHAVDTQFRTIRASWGRGIGGLSEGAPAVLMPAIAIATLTVGVNLLIDNLRRRGGRGQGAA